MEEVLLEAQGVKTGYGDTVVVSDAALTVKAGEVVAIVGPNGAGKSTLLKAIIGLLPIKNAPEGYVRFKGVDTTNWSVAKLVRKGMAFVPQTHNVFTNLTVIENMEMGGFTAHRAVKSRIAEILKDFPDLYSRPLAKGGDLSGGQRQMLALARALMPTPKLMLLDEPTAALAPKVAKDMLSLVKRIAAKGVAVLMVEQNVRMALEVSNRGYVMVDGRTVLEDQAVSIMNNPKIGHLFLGGHEAEEHGGFS